MKCSLVVTTLVLAAAAVAPPTLQAQSTPRRPNIVFMLVDNFGYGDLGIYGGGAVRGMPTPHLDTLAAQGMRLTNFNVEPECTPSRSAFLTGRMPIRSGTSRVPLPGVPQGFAPWEYTVAELLHDAGYRSAMYGKWHVGDVQGRYPSDQGFDEWWGFAHSSAESMMDIQPGWKPEYAKEQPIEAGRAGEPTKVVGTYNYAMRPLMDEEITRRSVEFIRHNARGDKPFFLFTSFSLPHSPPVPNPKFRNPEKTDYQNVLHEIDENAGAIIDAVDQAGIADDTIVIFTSDNGPQTHQGPNIVYGPTSDTGPFRGEFTSGWEGALRVPFVIRWPGRIPAGRASNEIVALLDMYRTFARFAGAEARVPTDRAVDSVDQADFFLGKQEKSNREHVMVFYDGKLLAVKWHQFKLHYNIRETARGDVRMPGQQMLTAYDYSLGIPWMFNVEADPKELWNIAPANTWVGVPTTRLIVAYEKSLEKYPNVPAGADGPKLSEAPAVAR